MKSAKFEFDGMFGLMELEFKGDTWRNVLFDFNRFQDLDCLLRQVFMMGTVDDRKCIPQFEEFAYKWQQGEVEKADFVNCRVGLSIGHICCLSATDENGEMVFPPWNETGSKAETEMTKQSPAKKSSSKKTTVKKSSEKNTPARKTVAKKSPVKKATAKKTTTKTQKQ